MQNIALLYNPSSGRARRRRIELIEDIARELRDAGRSVYVEPTRSAGSAGEQVRALLPCGFDTVLIAGGDGTINDALQGMVPSTAALGVVPMGTGNVLAHDLGLSGNPVRAVCQLLQWQRRRIALGRLEFTQRDGQTGRRWFIAVAGVGGSAKLMYDVHSGIKGTHGMAAYYAHMLRLVLVHRFPVFEVEYEDVNGATLRRTAAEADAVRIQNFGGLMRRWAWGAGLTRNDAQLVLFSTGKRLPFIHYTVSRILGGKWSTPGIELVHTRAVRCTALSPDQRLHAEADGEFVGGLPVKIEVVPDMLDLLMPA